MPFITKGGRTTQGHVYARVGGKRVKIQGRTARELLLGETDVKEWDDDELRAGRRRDRNGHLRGRPSLFVPRECHEELNRRMMSRAEQTLREALEGSAKELAAIAQGTKPGSKEQLKAIELVIERTLGKQTETVRVQHERPWMAALMAGIVADEEQAKEALGADVVRVDRDVIDAEVIEDDEDDAFEWENE